MELFASQRSDAITVAEIADAAGMTSAAVYYHFASKDDILLEGLRSLGEALVSEARRRQQDIAAREAPIGELPVRLVQWMDGRRAEAIVWFVKSSGVSLAVEQLRREVRGDLITVFTRAARAARAKISTAEAAVVATALLSLLETAATSWLTQDESLSGLGPKNFLDETGRLAERIAGV
jgi:AcrR family transcriptional regulator